MVRLQAAKQILMASCALALVACAQPTTRAPGYSAQELDAERRAQQEYVNQQKAQGAQQQNQQNAAQMKERLLKIFKPVSQAGFDVCKSLGARAADSNCVYSVMLTDEKDVNASADGTTIRVSQAMMNFARDDNELALVLSHEIAHNIMGHVASKKQNVLTGALLGFAVDALARSQGYDTGSGFYKAGASYGANAYSPEFEKEADYIGLYIMARGRFDYHSAPAFWRRMSVVNSDAIYTTTTHPTNPDRYLLLEKTAAEIDRKKQQGRPLVPEFKPAS